MIRIREMKTTAEVVLDVLPGTAREIGRRTGLSRTAVRRALRLLTKRRRAKGYRTRDGIRSTVLIYHRIL